MWGWLWAGVLVALILVSIAIWIYFRGQTYRRIFADSHFAEVARGVARVKSAAVERIILCEKDEMQSPSDPRILVTAAGLALVYSVRRVDDNYVHHYSVSVSGGYTAHAVGETFVLFIAKLLSVPSERLALGIGRSTIHHAEFQFSQTEQFAFAALPIPDVSIEEIAAFREEWLEIRKELKWQRLEAGAP
jgi:hypothetical protein